jgi:G:T/U-mismatch repair DNA glycosylase
MASSADDILRIFLALRHTPLWGVISAHLRRHRRSLDRLLAAYLLLLLAGYGYAHIVAPARAAAARHAACFSGS